MCLFQESQLLSVYCVLEISDKIREKSFGIRKQKFTITREGDTLYEKATLDGTDYDMSIKLNEELELKDPDFHLKVS